MALRGHETAAMSSGQAIRFLVTLIGSTHYAFPAYWVRGIISPAEQGAGEQITWANSSFERTDLAARLTMKALGETAETRIILYGNEQRSRSFAVDRVFGLVDVERVMIQTLPPQFRGSERNRLLGLFIDTAYIALITDPFWILELPPCKDVLEVFAFRASERRSEKRLPMLQASSAEEGKCDTDYRRPCEVSPEI
jgi:hypothetical protein